MKEETPQMKGKTTQIKGEVSQTLQTKTSPIKTKHSKSNWQIKSKVGKMKNDDSVPTSDSVTFKNAANNLISQHLI